MFNIGGGELLVILLVGLIVLGPSKLPEVARQVGSVARELRRMSTGFQAEMKAALDEPTEAAARERGNKVAGREVSQGPSRHDDAPEARTSDNAAEPEISSAEAAGMYDIGAPREGDSSATVVDDEAAPDTDDSPDNPT